MKRLATRFVVISCLCIGSAVWGQSSPTIGGANAITFPPVSLQMHCNEMVARYSVSADAARKVVPQGYELKLNQDGSATLMMPIQECSDIEDNYGVHIGKAGLAHLWIEIQRPPDATNPYVDPVPGAAWTWPTWYWYYHQGQTDSLLAAARIMLSGVQISVVEGVTLGGVGPGYRQGEVVERDHPLETYTWQEYSNPFTLPPYFPVPPVPAGVNHVLYRQQVGPSGPTLVTGKVRCLIQLYGMGMSKLTPDRLSLISRMGFDTQLSAPITLDFDQGCAVEFQVQSSH